MSKEDEKNTEENIITLPKDSWQEILLFYRNEIAPNF